MASTAPKPERKPQPFSQMAARQLRLLYLFTFFWIFLVIIPVLVPFLLNQGLTMQDVFLLQVGFGLTTLLLEVPSGYLADLWGRRRTLILGALLNGLGYTWLFFAHNRWDFLLFEMILGAAMAMASGTDLALIYAWMQQTELKREASTRMMAKRQLYSVVAESVASLLGGALILWGFGWVSGVQVLAAWVPFLIALQLREAPYEKMSERHRDNFREVLHFLFARERLLRLIFWNLTVWSLSTFVAVWMFQRYWQELKVPLAWFGLLWAGYNLTVGLSGHWVLTLEQKLGSRFVLGLLAALPPLAYALMAVFLGLNWVWAGLLAGLGFQVSRGIAQVLLRDAFNWRLPEKFRATANSLASMAFRLGFALLGPLAGWLIDHRGLQVALEVQAVIFTLPLLGVMGPLWWILPGQRAKRLQQKQTKS